MLRPTVCANGAIDHLSTLRDVFTLSWLFMTHGNPKPLFDKKKAETLHLAITLTQTRRSIPGSQPTHSADLSAPRLSGERASTVCTRSRPPLTLPSLSQGEEPARGSDQQHLRRRGNDPGAAQQPAQQDGLQHPVRRRRRRRLHGLAAVERQLLAAGHARQARSARRGRGGRGERARRERGGREGARRR